VKPPDEFGSYYGSVIEASYDCVDRLTINAYFPLGQSAGGFRSWWRPWQGGEQRLNDAGLKGAAGDLARELRPKDPNFRGVFAVLVGRAPAPVWEVRHNQAGKITELRHPETWPHVQHYYFQIQDPQWGHIVVRLGGYPPWGAQLILNGQRPQELEALCERWLYSRCLCFGLPVAEQESSGFRYRYSVWQQEYSRIFLFREADTLEEVFQKLLDRTREPLDIKVLETIFGRRHRQPKRNKQRAGRAAVEVSKEVDQREWYTTVFRVRWGNLLLKIYDKSGRVLRVCGSARKGPQTADGRGGPKPRQSGSQTPLSLGPTLPGPPGPHEASLPDPGFEYQPADKLTQPCWCFLCDEV